MFPTVKCSGSSYEPSERAGLEEYRIFLLLPGGKMQSGNDAALFWAEVQLVPDSLKSSGFQSRPHELRVFLCLPSLKAPESAQEGLNNDLLKDSGVQGQHKNLQHSES